MTNEKGARLASILGQTAVVLGNVRGQGDLEIRGRVQGNITVAGRITVGHDGLVLGGIEADQITVQGRVHGDLNAKDAIFVFVSGEVEGNLSAPRVAIEAGARVFGTLRTTPAGEASRAPEAKQQPTEKVHRPPVPRADGGEKPRARAAQEDPSPRIAPEPKGHRPKIPTFARGAHGKSKPNQEA